MENVFIIAGKRTPVGGYLGSLSQYSAPELGATAIREVVDSTKIDVNQIDEVIFGNVLSGNLGQSPARQAAKLAGILDHTDATTINKVCSSGLKSISYAVQSIQSANSEVVIAGGMESMSNAPFYLEKHRNGNKLGHHQLIDGMLKDGLWDPYNDYHMGNAAELANVKYKVSREEQDAFALLSFERAQKAQDSSKFKNEIVPISIQSKQGQCSLDIDEDVSKLNPSKMKQLNPIFEKTGSITAANASNLNDGAAALLIASKIYIEQNGITPLARILSFSDAAQAPEWFTTSPTLAIQKALKKANLSIEDIDYFEINEAYANVPIINAQLLNVDLKKVNVNGGAVAIGHPLGASGARIVITLSNILIQNKARYGVAAICNGGGGATAIIIENTNL
jgi:acetyl-CoA C-acetyltransferase